MMHQQTIFKCSNNNELNVRIGKATDIGGNVTNQDDYYVVESEHFTAISVMDGHGENGEFIANRCKVLMEQKFLENKEDVLLNPVTFLRDCFVQLHEQVTLDLIEQMRLQGIETMTDPSGFLLQKRTNARSWKLFKIGGATKTIVLLIKPTLKLYIANAGDSDALLCSSYPIIKQSDLKCESSELHEPHKEKNMDVNITEQNASTDILSKMLILTKDHSATSQEEYIRIQSIENSSNTKIKAVYDNAEGSNKSKCPEIFSISESGILSINDPPSDNCYYKNVREEYATYITTPPNNAHEYALSVTRSICDNYLMQYGLTCCPEIQSIELSNLFDNLEYINKDMIDKSNNSSEFGQTICVLLATDGVWDNWKYDDVNAFVMHESCLNELFNKQCGSQTVIDSFMERNKLLAHHNFGADSDNATSILMYVTRKQVNI